MFCERLHFTFVGVVATLADSVVVAEFAGYWLHRVLHGGKFPGHSWGHLMRHYLLHGARHTLLGWPVPMFSYWYDRMHKRNSG